MLTVLVTTQMGVEAYKPVGFELIELDKYRCLNSRRF